MQASALLVYAFQKNPAHRQQSISDIRTMSYRSLRADKRERVKALPGDEYIPEPLASLTNAVTIHRPPQDVWPWLIQMGADRAGWYSYDFIDNDRVPSAGFIVSELQHIERGMLVPSLPGAMTGFHVLDFKRERYLILGRLLPGRERPRMTWAFILEEPEPGHTRLIVRVRGIVITHLMCLPGWLSQKLAPLGHAIMQRKQLRGIVWRTETHD